MNVQITDLAPVAPAARPRAGQSAGDEGQQSFGDLLDSLLGDQGGSAAGPDAAAEAGLIGLGGFVTLAPVGRPGPGVVPGGVGPAVEAGAAHPAPVPLAVLAGSVPTGPIGTGPMLAGAIPTGPTQGVSTLPGAILPGTGPVPAPVAGAVPAPATVVPATPDPTAAPVAGPPLGVPAEAAEPAAEPTGAGAVPAGDQTGTPVEATVGGGTANGTDLGDQATAPRGENPAARPADLAAPTAQAAFTAIPGAGSTTPSAAPAGPAGTAGAPAPVSAQLFDAVTQAVQGGEGSHRMTVRLDPGTLGEVRVHLVARDGALQVHLTAGHEALAALGDGSGELQRLLQSTGAVDVKVTVRDLGAGAHQPNHDGSPGSADTSGTSGGSAGDRTGREQGDPTPTPDLRAWMPESTTPQRGQGQGGPVPHDPTGSTPTRVDLAL